MPTYEYVCRACGEHLEVVQSFKDEALVTCGLCGGDLRKVFSAAGIIFKGSGYYVTDTRADDKKAGATTQAKGEGASKSDSAATSDSASTSSGGEGSGAASSDAQSA